MDSPIPIRPKAVRFPLTEIFGSIQGEGHFVGTYQAFVRVAHCAVGACHIRHMCDEKPWKATMSFTTEEIVARVNSLIAPGGIVSITGGEPAGLGYNLIVLIRALRDAGFQVHMETSGAIALPGVALDWLTVSPKTGPNYLQRIGHTFKLVVMPGWTLEDILPYVQDTSFFHYYLSPVWDEAGEPVNLGQVMDLICSPRNIAMGGKFALSVQLHKMIGVK